MAHHVLTLPCLGVLIVIYKCLTVCAFIELLPTVSATEVMQMLSSVCPSVRLFPLYVRNQLNVDLELLYVERT